MKQLLITLLTLTIFVSCNFNPPKTTQSFKRILPDTSKTHKPNWFYDETSNLTEELNFTRFDNGVDSFAILIWVSGIFVPSNVISIHYSNNHWFTTNTYYWTSFPEVGEKDYHGGVNMESLTKLIIGSAQTFRIKTSIPFSRIIYTIEQFNILNIPTQEEIPNFKDRVADGFSYVIEIATKDYYKTISYQCPDIYKDEINNKKVTEFLDFISKNLTEIMMCRS
ncbi:hypothetical protein BH10BAC2_BH10BAC2_17400 [soil metagenome]